MNRDIETLLNASARSAPDLPAGLVEEGLMRGRSLRRRRRAFAGLGTGMTVVATISVLTLVGRDPAPVSPAGAVDEIAVHDGHVCPEQLADPGDSHGFGTSEPAAKAPTLTAADSAWVCEYRVKDAPADPGGDRRFVWVQAGPVSPVPTDRLSKLQDLVAEMRPAARDRECRANLGPRWMLVLANRGDMTGVVLDDYGCDEIRLTDDPFVNPPGEATTGGGVEGVLTADGALLEQVRLIPAATGFSLIVTPADWNNYPEAGISGLLQVRAGCLLIGDAVVWWPGGTRWDPVTKTISYDGRVWGRLGQEFSGGGGSYPKPRDLAPFLPDPTITALEDCMGATRTSRTVFAYGDFGVP